MSTTSVKKALLLAGKIVGLRRRLLEFSGLALCLQFIAILLPLFTQWIIDFVMPSGDRELLAIIITGLVAILILQVVLDVISAYAAMLVEAQFEVQWSKKIIWHLVKLPVRWFDDYELGDIVSRFNSMKAIQTAIANGLTGLAVNSLFLLLSFVVMLAYSVQLAAIAIGATVIYLSVKIFTFQRLRKHNKRYLEIDGSVQSVFIENLQCIETIKLASIERQRLDKWMNQQMESVRMRMVLKKYAVAYGALHSIIQGAETTLILGLGSSLVINNSLTLGMLIAFIAYKAEFANRAQRVIDGLIDFAMLKVHVDRLSAILLAPTEELLGSAHSKIFENTSPSIISIELINVSYRYSDTGPWVIKNLSLTIEAGEHLAITGETGCGKSTLGKIILGLILPTSGVVKLNGVSVNEMGLRSWRCNFAAVMQDDQLFAASIAENIALSSIIDRRRLEDAARLAQVDKEIYSMPNGYETNLKASGHSISGGQKQRLMIARAIYKQAPIMIFDEATSHLDEGTERRLNSSIASLSLTIISIAHRTETIKAATREFSMKRIEQ